MQLKFNCSAIDTIWDKLIRSIRSEYNSNILYNIVLIKTQIAQLVYSTLIVRNVQVALSSILPLPYPFYGSSTQSFRAIDKKSNMADKEKMESDCFLKSICKYLLVHE